MAGADWNAELERIRKRYAKFKSNRAREAVYEYLEVVYRMAWRLKRLGLSESDEALVKILGPSSKPVIRRIIDKTSDDKPEQKSKWFRALLFCFKKEKDPKLLVKFMRNKRRGGINKCAARVSKKATRAAKRKTRKMLDR